LQEILENFSLKQKERGNMIQLNFLDSIKRMTENKSSRVLDTEYMKGRPTLHNTVYGEGYRIRRNEYPSLDE
jgi:hypothetical protein